MAVITLRRLRCYLGTKPCADCGAQLQWDELYKDPRKAANTTRTVCFECILHWAHLLRHTLVIQATFPTTERAAK